MKADRMGTHTEQVRARKGRMSPAQCGRLESVAVEMFALWRIKDSLSSVPEFVGPGMYEQLFSIANINDVLHVDIDFYSQRMLPDIDNFDENVWDAEMLHLEFRPVDRKTYNAAYTIVRALLGGRVVSIGDGTTLSRDSYIAQVHASEQNCAIAGK